MGAHMMPGIPIYLYYIAVVCVMVVSFVLFITTPSSKYKSPHRKTYDLLQWKWCAKLATSRIFPASLKMITVFLFIMIILTGLFGIQKPGENLSTILTWTIWWILLVLLILFAGKLWCYVCPWDAIATWMDKLHLWKVKHSVFSLRKRWPRKLRNIYLAIFLFLGLTWLELGWGVTTKPAITAYLALLILLMAIVSVLIFDRKSFCRYGCLIGRISGLYALISPIEIRARDKSVCITCKTKDCLHGNAKGYPCPTYQYLGSMEKNTYCIMCMECINSCEKQNATINLRPFGVDLLKISRARTDEAALVLTMLAMTSFHGLTMTPLWYALIGELERWFGIGYIAAFSIGMGASLAAVALFYFIIVALTWIIINKSIRLKDMLIKYAYCLLPIALFYHLAHNTMHFAMEGGKIVSSISDPFGFGWNIFGTSTLSINPLINIHTIWILQVLFIMIGHVWSLYIGHHIASHLYNEKKSLKVELPIFLAMVVYSVMSLYLVAQPMEMRTSM
jgi:polyferredoxin